MGNSTFDLTRLEWRAVLDAMKEEKIFKKLGERSSEFVCGIAYIVDWIADKAGDSDLKWRINLYE